jgi:hypothetical protein
MRDNRKRACEATPVYPFVAPVEGIEERHETQAGAVSAATSYPDAHVHEEEEDLDGDGFVYVVCTSVYCADEV